MPIGWTDCWIPDSVGVPCFLENKPYLLYQRYTSEIIYGSWNRISGLADARHHWWGSRTQQANWLSPYCLERCFAKASKFKAHSDVSYYWYWTVPVCLNYVFTKFLFNMLRFLCRRYFEDAFHVNIPGYVHPVTEIYLEDILA